MKRMAIALILLALLMAFFVHIEFRGENQLRAESMMALGFTLMVAYLFGKMVTRIRLPKITGYILAGILFGPYVFNLLSKPVVVNLQLIDNIALSLIALTAGGEFRYKAIKPQLKTIGSAIFWQVVVVMFCFLLFIPLYKQNIAFLANQTLPVVIGVALIFGALSIAKSPATTIAIITETGARGRFTDFVLGVTVFKDIIVVLIFSITLAFSKPLILEESKLQMGYVFTVIFEIASSIIAGFGAGFLILLYLKYINRQKALFLLGAILLGIELSVLFHLEVILVFMVAGFFIQNFSGAGDELIRAIESTSLPIFVTFFTIAGASLNFPIFLEYWSLALLMVVLRAATTYGGTYLGGKLTGASSEIKNYGWMGFIGQAGLTLGLSILVVKNIPGPIGLSIRTLVIATIAINQIIGPVLFRYAVEKVGEARTI